MIQLKFLACVAVLLPLCSTFSWTGVQYPPPPPLPPSTRAGATFDSQNSPHTHDAVIEDLKGYIQVKTSLHKNSRSTPFDLSKLKTYLKEVDHQLMALQSQMASLQQAKQTLDIIKNAFGGHSNCGGGFTDPIPPPPCPPCPRCDNFTCPPPPTILCPPPPPVYCPPPRPQIYPTTTTTTTESPEEEFGSQNPQSDDSDEW